MSESKGCSVIAVVMVAILMLVIGVAAGGAAVWFGYVQNADPPVADEPATKNVVVTTPPPAAIERYAALLPLEDTLQIEGPLPPASVKELVLGGNRFKLRECYQKGMDRKPTLKGEMSLQFTVAGSNGKVTAAIERNTDFADKGVSKCILDEVKSWTFPPQKAQSVVKFDLLMMSLTGADAQ